VSTEEAKALDAELARAGTELEHIRDQFVVSIGSLEREVTRALDWREWVRRKPAITLCLAFGLGTFLGRRN